MVKGKRKNIPVFDQHKAAKAGFFIKSLSESLHDVEHDVVNAHRDDAYLLFILKTGFCRELIDFEEYTFSGPSFCMIHPEQVHGLLEHRDLDGWMISFDPGLLAQETTQLTRLINFSPIPEQEAGSLSMIYELTDLLWRQFHSNENTTHQSLTLRYLLNALITAIVSLSQSGKTLPESIENRPDEITGAFRQLVKQNFIHWKRPAHYAAALHLSVNHLNDTVRQKTGFSVSYWIQHQTMLEARRLLYHTQQTVKEVAYELGFEDQHYFSRLFRKVTGQTPLSFRQSFRDLSTRSPL
ncbi:helix-turn-helix domain-containing protein [Spirosoma sp. HMF4905]|uniref:Helix-turn-helix domain-containing protein n=1 Tax=Spirosoma arboris TaxID=2682092 RepID=A0A7K1SH66_9BACT|nr:AraC family transcriptional regulator [Spirosoma arboris]MVM33103.1 helix-turn-helix domain-containing protein [Spirosoma arboris]